MALIEDCANFVTLFEERDMLADFFNNACAVGCRDYVVFDGEGVGSFGDDQVTIVERDSMDY